MLTFHGKVGGKSEWTRGLFVSMLGFSVESLSSMNVGNKPNFVIMNGIEVEKILRGHLNLDDCLRTKVRILGETGDFALDSS